MTNERKAEIIKMMQNIADGFKPTRDEPKLTMFSLISRYNATGENVELIGGDWAKENGFDLPY
jgi:hypothetical protein